MRPGRVILLTSPSASRRPKRRVPVSVVRGAAPRHVSFPQLDRNGRRRVAGCIFTPAPRVLPSTHLRAETFSVYYLHSSTHFISWDISISGPRWNHNNDGQKVDEMKQNKINSFLRAIQVQTVHLMDEIKS